MATWTFSDQTRVNTGGQVTGGTVFAQHLKDCLDAARDGEFMPVILAPPAQSVALDVDNNWLLHMFLERQGNPFSVKLRSSTYLPDDADAPNEGNKRATKGQQNRR